MKKNLKGKVLNIEQIAKGAFLLEFSSPVTEILPGNFLSILIPNKTFRRPFSIANFEKTEKGDGKISVLFKLKGEGTNYLKNLKIGDNIDYLAPLGNNFETGGRALLIGAGIGIAPMLYLKKVLNQKGIENLLVTGFKDEEEVIKGSDKTIVGGSVLDSIQDLINEFKPEILYSCGPSIVLENVCKIAEKNNLKAQIAMEKVMACGIGVCRGCVIKLKDKNGEKTASVCKDGPIFYGREVIWQ